MKIKYYIPCVKMLFKIYIIMQFDVTVLYVGISVLHVNYSCIIVLNQMTRHYTCVEVRIIFVSYNRGRTSVSSLETQCVPDKS